MGSMEDIFYTRNVPLWIHGLVAVFHGDAAVPIPICGTHNTSFARLVPLTELMQQVNLVLPKTLVRNERIQKCWYYTLGCFFPIIFMIIMIICKGSGFCCNGCRCCSCCCAYSCCCFASCLFYVIVLILLVECWLCYLLFLSLYNCFQCQVHSY